MWYTTWSVLAKRWIEINKPWRKKEMHNLAKQLVDLLAETDDSWKNTTTARHRTISVVRSHERPHRTRCRQSYIYPIAYDREGNTVLHYTAEFHGGSQPGYAVQLQEELHWFDNNSNKTAKQLFMEKHEPLFKDARQWIKETSQSCSAVAVLVATVVFAAAYTIPGGANDNGFPIFLDNPIFIVFTVMYVVALVSSLASVVMLLSILTSPCEMWDFRKSLPQLCNILAVCIFALVEFPLYVAVKGCVRTILKTLKKIIPRFLLN
ncbi:hypothetical protein GYH30_041772 [Glycine max]|uniref:PGG domain-containing protein n=1 Tax=Glycine max TaxID=3847 RepID=A0A0R0FY37_SOYBN|nr:hypothetical protein GYH30_041772 [Glycine max]